MDVQKVNFVFLDSFRGLCALFVMIHHSSFWHHHNESWHVHKLLKVITYLAITLAVNGFFILSAFLLTYRLLKELFQLEIKSSKNIFIVLSKYFVRRFFRIYMVFVVYCSIIKFAPDSWNLSYMPTAANSKLSPSWSSLVFFKDSGSSHLWTILPEIKYYFLIPILCLPVLFRFRLTGLIIILTFFILNILSVNKNIYGVTNYDGNAVWEVNFPLSFPIFLNGSLIAFLIFYLETYRNSFFNYNFLISIILNLICLSLIFCGIYYSKDLLLQRKYFFSPYHYSSLIWALTLFLMFISKERINVIKKYFFEENNFLKKMGKISFGIYLWHPSTIYFVTYLSKKYDLRVFSDLDRDIIQFFLLILVSFLFYIIFEKNFISIAQFLCKKMDEFIQKPKTLISE